MKLQDAIRVLVHLMLAAFLANAANKFFVPDLEADESRYRLIFQFIGEAPDQYRILPLLPLKALCSIWTWHTAVLVYNFALGFLCLEMFTPLLPWKGQHQRLAFSAVFSVAFIYLLYTGWRPDTLGLLLVCLAVCLLALRMKEGPVKDMAITLVLIALAFSRAEIAMAYGFVLALQGRRRWAMAVLWVGMAAGVQLLLSKVVFPKAQYTTDTVMLKANLSGYYLVRNPATWLILAMCLIWWKALSTYLKTSWKKFFYFYLAALGYVLLVLVIGRVNEYRLYLPFLPLLLLLNAATNYHGQKTSSL
jgi:hypothetical protein